MTSLLGPFFNLFILLGALLYYLRAPLRQYVVQRHTTMKEELYLVSDQLQKAQGQYEEFSSKLKAVEVEVAALRNQALQDAQAMKARIATEAKKASANIISDARASAEGLVSELRNQLYADMGASVLMRAETLLRERLTGEDRERIQQEFSRQVETIQ